MQQQQRHVSRQYSCYYVNTKRPAAEAAAAAADAEVLQTTKSDKNIETKMQAESEKRRRVEDASKNLPQPDCPGTAGLSQTNQPGLFNIIRAPENERCADEGERLTMLQWKVAHEAEEEADAEDCETPHGSFHFLLTK